jgi:hypothetical protein
LIKGIGSDTWLDLTREYPRVFSKKHGAPACRDGKLYVHEKCALALRRTRPAPGMNLCESASYHYHFLIPNIALLALLLRPAQLANQAN